WLPVTEPRTITILHLENNKNRIYCSEPNFLPTSDVVSCSSNTDGSWTQFEWSKSVDFQNWAEYRVLVNGQVLQTTGSSAQLGFNSGAGYLQTWWAAYGGGLFQPSATLTIEQRITSTGSWLQIAGPRTIYWQHLSNSNNRVLCSSPPPLVPEGASIGLSGDGIYSMQFTWTNNPTYGSLSTYQLWFGNLLLTTTNPNTYNYSWSVQNNQGLLSGLMPPNPADGSSVPITITVKQSLDGINWDTYATRAANVVYVATPAWVPHYQVQW
ncbi:MAG TPA: hypothetical protein VNQ52_05340, partial [Microbacteriaceae bacterium]|nr:hypothetical protein [Microbacteriaceae bacterium]